MAIVAPVFTTARVGQDVSEVITVPTDTTDWHVTATLRSGAAVVATKTIGTGITNTSGASSSTLTIAWAAADLTGLAPGAYTWDLTRTDVGNVYPIVDASTFLLSPANDADYNGLTNLSELLVHLKASATVSDADAQFYLQLILASERTIRDLCGREFTYGTYTQYLDAPLRNNLWVRETPINSIVSIAFDGAGGYGQIANTFGPETLLDPTTDYFFRKDRSDGLGHSGEIFTTRQGGWGWWGYGAIRGWGINFFPGQLATKPISIPGAFRVIYRAGYPIIPGPIKTAVHEVVADRMRAARRGVGVQSESGMNYSYSLGDWTHEAQKLLSVQQVINTYRRGDAYVG